MSRGPIRAREYRAGFEIRTSLRCRAIRVTTHAADGVTRPVREYRFAYRQAAFNGASLLARIDVTGIGDPDPAAGTGPVSEALPPLTFGYTGFEPGQQRFEQVTGPGLPTSSLSDPGLALVDLHGARPAGRDRVRRGSPVLAQPAAAAGSICPASWPRRRRSRPRRTPACS